MNLKKLVAIVSPERICIVLAAPSFDNGFSNTLCLASVAVRSNISEFRSRMDWISSSEDFYWPLGCCWGKNHLQLESLSRYFVSRSQPPLLQREVMDNSSHASFQGHFVKHDCRSGGRDFLLGAHQIQGFSKHIRMTFSTGIAISGHIHRFRESCQNGLLSRIKISPPL